MLNLIVILGFLSSIGDKLHTLAALVIKVIIGIMIVLFILFIYIPLNLISNFTFDFNEYYSQVEEDLCIDLPEKYLSKDHSLLYAGFELEIDITLSYEDNEVGEIIKEFEGIDSCKNGRWTKIDQGYSFETIGNHLELGYFIEAELDTESGVLEYDFYDM